MQALEAMQRLITLADHYRIEEGGRPDPKEQEQDMIAVAIIQAMLNTALPVARFRCFVEVDEQQPRHKVAGLKKSPVTQEFTICGLTATAIKGGLVGLTIVPIDVRITLWEQRATGADMVSGFQGPTKSKRFQSWVDEILLLDIPAEGQG